MKKRNIFIAIALLIVCASIYGFVEYNRTAKDLVYVKPKQVTSATTIIEAFVNNEPSANKQYLGQVVAVDGIIRDIEVDNESNWIIVLKGTASNSSIRCNMDSKHIEVLTDLYDEAEVTVKGVVTGYNADETGLLGSDVLLNRCVIDSKK